MQNVLFSLMALGVLAPVQAAPQLSPIASPAAASVEAGHMLEVRELCITYLDDAQARAAIAAARGCLTPAGRLEWRADRRVVSVRDVPAIADTVARLIERLDTPPAQVFVDVQLVSTTNADLHAEGIVVDGKVLKDGVGTLLPTQKTAVLELLAKDPKSRVRQLPKVIALDRQEATLFVGERRRGQPDDGVEVAVRPMCVGGTDRIVLDLEFAAPEATGLDDTTPRLAVVPSGHTVVVRAFSAADRGALLLVTPRLMRAPRDG